MTASLKSIRVVEFSELSSTELTAYYIFLKLVPFRILQAESDEYRECLRELSRREIDSTAILVRDPSPTAKSLTAELEQTLRYKDRFFQLFCSEQLAELAAEKKAEADEKLRIQLEKQQEKEQKKQARLDERNRKRLEKAAAAGSPTKRASKSVVNSEAVTEREDGAVERPASTDAVTDLPSTARDSLEVEAVPPDEVATASDTPEPSQVSQVSQMAEPAPLPTASSEAEPLLPKRRRLL